MHFRYKALTALAVLVLLAACLLSACITCGSAELLQSSGESASEISSASSQVSSSPSSRTSSSVSSKEVSSETPSSSEASSEETISKDPSSEPVSEAPAVSQAPASSEAPVSSEAPKNEEPVDVKPVQSYVRTPVASGTAVYQNELVTLDASNTSEGYIMLLYSGGNGKIKVQITRDGGTTYTYNLNGRSSYEVFPLTEGNGNYAVSVFENITGTSYVQVFGESVSVSLSNSFLPFLYPNQYVNFYTGSAAIQKGAELAAKGSTDSEVVQQIYNYVINTISYDTAKVSAVQSGYLPNIDQTLSSKTGICFDYAALMTAMLRSQNIPCKLIVGYTGAEYHAWINVYLSEIGWVDNMIYFDGKSWTLMDPTYASTGKGDSAVQQYIINSANYQQKYAY